MTTPSPPKDLDAAARKVWRDALADLQASEVWTPATEPLLIAYVRALMSARLARARIAKRAAEFGDEAAYHSRGSLKQITRHPDVDIEVTAIREASRLAGELILSPKAKAQHRAALAAIAPDGDLDRFLAELQGGK